MRKRLLGISLLIPYLLWVKSTSVESSTKKYVQIDNEYIQTYNEKPGKWLNSLESGHTIDSYLKEIESSEAELRDINKISSGESIQFKRPIFFPFGEKYAQVLSNTGKGREIILSDSRELIWPVGSYNARISSKIGMRNNSMHTGIDIACPMMSPVVAAGDGIVLTSRAQGNYGMVVIVQHEINRIQTLYAHNSILYVKEGERVTKGQIIALSGNTGHSTGPHVHFEVRYLNIVLNPEHYITPPKASESLTKLANKDSF